MRRKDREVTDFATVCRIVDACRVVRIGLTDGDMYPYIVPMNFGYAVEDGRLCLYVHGAMAGRKYELMQKNRVCSFEMDCDHRMAFLDKTRDVTMHYRCVMGKADIEFLEGEEKQRGIDILMARDRATRGYPYDRAPLAHTAVMKLTVTEWTGKTNPGPGAGE